MILLYVMNLKGDLYPFDRIKQANGYRTKRYRLDTQ